jgi:hypothetical protein
MRFSMGENRSVAAMRAQNQPSVNTSNNHPLRRLSVKNVKAIIAGLTSVLLVSACATQPIGPTVQVMPASGKAFDVFAQEESTCKAYAQGQIAGAVDQANNSAIATGVLSTALGAGLGAAVGGGQGAGVGAASGAVVGTGVGANGTASAQATIQQRYDIAYSQCMYSKGNQVPGYEAAAPVSLPPPAPAPVASAPSGPHYDPTLVIAIQTELARIGLLNGTPDGAYGPKTRGAIADYEKMRGLPRDGIPTKSLLEDLKQN